MFSLYLFSISIFLSSFLSVSLYCLFYIFLLSFLHTFFSICLLRVFSMVLLIYVSIVFSIFFVLVSLLYIFYSLFYLFFFLASFLYTFFLHRFAQVHIFLRSFLSFLSFSFLHPSFLFYFYDYLQSFRLNNKMKTFLLHSSFHGEWDLVSHKIPSLSLSLCCFGLSLFLSFFQSVCLYLVL